ncbi:L-aspartate oxidase [Brevibacterium sanguinis]|uniref:L-aspartate oxidase n=2 Tax=Brevibacterium TaxID=1696 RepID=A0A366IMS7_9MICO|nr:MULTISPECIES: FAD-binding protein [Brevibacterium]RBP68205.1 L-aspartate oxidase [Brevibacterium sanguinis]RBP74378.1 L-aspartate oxidase [Brevibacterium celere]
MAHVVILGSGIAGLTTALRLVGHHDVTLVTKGRLGASTTALAQGGIAGALFPDDSVDSHVADTLAAGSGLCDEAAVRALCSEGPPRILDLAAAGVRFDRAPARPGAGGVRPGEVWRDWARGLEGAHSVPRIYHSGGDATGRAIIDALTLALRAEAVAGTVVLREHSMLVDVLPGRGVTLLGAGAVETLSADAVVLATGGAGRLYAHTTNPPGATGDGLAAAIRAGAAVRDLEFCQFHPTALAGTGFLVSEAVRGAGAVLRDARGTRFMPRLDPRGELAPRDVVALAIHRAMARQGGAPCFLDARAVPEVTARFPTIAAGLAEHGLDPARDLVPVTPAAHYLMGGVATDLEGRTSIESLYAVGEVACTRVHGANRLASNSLVEGAVFGVRTAAAIRADLAGDHAWPGPDATAVSTDGPCAVGPSGGPAPTSVLPVPSTGRPGTWSREQIQALAWAHLGVERDEHGLRTVLDRLGAGAVPTSPAANPAASAAAAVPAPEDPTDLASAIETANLALLARTVAAHALAREESRGAHVRVDRPLPAPALPEVLPC